MSMTLPVATSSNSTTPATSLRNFSYPIAVAQYIPAPNLSQVPLISQDCSLLPHAFTEKRKSLQRRSHLFYWTPPDPPAKSIGADCHNHNHDQQQAFSPRRRSILQGLTWSSTLLGSPAMGGRHPDQPVDAPSDSVGHLNSHPLTATSSTANLSTSSNGSTNRKPTKWLSNLVDWLGTSEPSAQQWKDHQSELFRRCNISKADSAQTRSMKLHAPAGELPSDAPSPVHRDRRPARVAHDSSGSTSSLSHVAPWED